MATTYLERTPSSAGNRKTFTFSTWIKRSTVQDGAMLMAGTGTADRTMLTFESDGSIFWRNEISDVDKKVQTNRLLRDTNGWYHIVLAVDTTQATDSNRVKIYVNGVQETSLAQATYPSQNEDCYINNNQVHRIGSFSYSVAGLFNGSMSHIHFIDGTAYDASAFGETDANGVWKIKTSPSVTYGTNGFFILKDGNSVTDQSGNSNNFTVAGGTLTNTEDNPSNVFATFNPLFNYNAQATFSNGNLQVSTSNSATNITPLVSTLGMSSGKYYAEIKYSATTDPGDFARIGVCSKVADRGTNVALENDVDDHAYQGSNGNYLNNTNSTSYGATYTTGDIIGVALDLDNGYIYFHKNGTYQNSGDPTSGATGTGGKSVSTGKDYFFAVADVDYLDSYTYQANFGNGYFGTTAVASAGTNASGIGIFEYDVPTGYTALSTKGLNL